MITPHRSQAFNAAIAALTQMPRRLRGGRHGVKLLPVNRVLLRRAPSPTCSHPQSPLCTPQGGLTTFLCHLQGTGAHIQFKVTQIQPQTGGLLSSPFSVPVPGSETELRGSPKSCSWATRSPTASPNPRLRQAWAVGQAEWQGELGEWRSPAGPWYAASFLHTYILAEMAVGKL